MLKEFKTFIAQGNVLDLAVGVVIGAAFGKIVTSLVDDIISPIIGLVLGNDLPSVKAVLRAADPANNVTEIAIKYGNFLNTIIQFILVAWVIFMIVKAANNMKLSSSLEKKDA